MKYWADSDMGAQRSSNIELEIIALDFYDGATEGFALSLGVHGPCYFKMLAWDDTQERRLFALAKIDGALIEELVTLLEPQERVPSSRIWIPKWKFHQAGEEKRADDIVSSSQDRLRLSGSLVLGSAITDASAKEIEFDGEVARHVGQFLITTEPDRLSNWLSYFE
jgi:hypothetical protein